VDRILNNRTQLSAIGRSASGGKELMKKLFFKTLPPIPLFLVKRGGQRERFCSRTLQGARMNAG
jgi:hypothetical protein